MEALCRSFTHEKHCSSTYDGAEKGDSEEWKYLCVAHKQYGLDCKDSKIDPKTNLDAPILALRREFRYAEDDAPTIALR